MTDPLDPNDFKPELISVMKSVLEKASAYIDNASGKPATAGATRGSGSKRSWV